MDIPSPVLDQQSGSAVYLKKSHTSVRNTRGQLANCSVNAVGRESAEECNINSKAEQSAHPRRGVVLSDTSAISTDRDHPDNERHYRTKRPVGYTR